jgi:hypothetical protein
VVLLADQDQGRLANIWGTGTKAQEFVQGLQALRG